MKKSTIAIMIALVVVITAGCSTKPQEGKDSAQFTSKPIIPTTPSTPQLETGFVSFREPYPYSGSHDTTTGTITEHDGVKYNFDSGVTEENCIEILYRIEKAIQTIERRIAKADSACEVYICKNDYLPRVYEHKLYVGVPNLYTLEYITGLIQMLYGYELNYGLAYALGCDIAAELDISCEENTIPLSEALELGKTVPAYLDLNYACFSNVYADDVQVEQIKALACYFYDYLRTEDKTDIFAQYSDEKYCTYLNAFLAKNGLPAYDNSGLAGTIFFNGGENVQMAWKNRVGEFYIESGYTVTYMDTPIFTQDMVNSNYSNLRRIIVDYIAQAAYMRSILQDYELNNDDLQVLFITDKENSRKAAGMYFPWKNEIRLFAVSPFMHEYTHYLLDGYLPSGWKNEVIPTYYGNDPVDAHITYPWYSDMVKYLSLDPNNPEDAEDYAFIQRIYANLDHEFDWNSMDDFQYLLDAYIVKRDWSYKLTDIYSGVATRSSFFHFLTKLESKEAATAALLYDTPQTYYALSWLELIDLWELDLQTRFAWVNQ